MSGPPDAALPGFAWEPLRRLHADVEALFAECRALLGGSVPVPRVTFELPATDAEPLHVYTVSGVREFDVAGSLSDGSVKMSFTADVVCLATADSFDEAARIAAAYQALLLQVPLCDPLLGGTVDEVGAPQVVEYETWAEDGGRRHAGYRMGYNMSRTVAPNAACRLVIERMGA